MKWEPHYTGIETYELRFAQIALYLQRDRMSKRLEFVRLSYPWPFRRYCKMLGAHLTRTNYGSNPFQSPGWEVFTDALHFGWHGKKAYLGMLHRVCWHGSSVDPYRAVTLHLGRVFIGANNTPKWLQAFPRRREQREWERYADDMEESHKYHE